MSLQLMIRYSDGDGGGTSSWTDLPLPSEMMRKGHTLLGFLWAGYCSFFGGTLQYYIRKEQKPVPLFLGYSLLLVVVGYILLPLSSFWLLIPQALIMIGGTSMGVKGY